MRQRSTRPGRQYAAIPNAAMRDQRLSIEARGVLALLMTYSDDWIFRTAHLLETTGLGRDKFRRVMKELADLGYVKLEAARGDGGRLVGSEWVIQDDGDGKADRGPENPALGDATEALKNRPPVKPTAGESVPLRKPISKKTNLEENQGGSGLFSEMEDPQSKNQGPDPFERFWEAFPPGRKTGKSKAQVLFWQIVRGKHRKLGQASADVLIEAAAAFAATGPDPHWTPMPTTWLNDQRWLAELPKAFDPPKPSGPSRGHRASTQQWGEVVR
jgi:hypothetical protein